MYHLPGNNIAFVFSDPAGANACIALSRMCKMEMEQSTLLFSNKKYSDAGYDLSVTDSVPSFGSLGIDCVFTGTSHPASSGYFEVNCIKQALKENIYTISFIDHWINFRLRFAGLNTSEYPDEIWVVDEQAKNIAVSEGLPREKLFVRGNPYHYYLKTYWQPKYKSKGYLEVLGIPAAGNHILFAPDPLSLRDGKVVAGFDEEEALADLLALLPQLNGETGLIVKSHPLQPVQKLSELIKNAGIGNCWLIREADALELLNACDLVIGFYSNLLLEAEVLGKRVIRYFPGKPEADLLRHKRTLKAVKDRGELLREIINCMSVT